MNSTFLSISGCTALILCLAISCEKQKPSNTQLNQEISSTETSLSNERDSLEVIIGTFLGNDQRNYYGDSIGVALTELWKLHLGTGTTNLADGPVEWSGAGWTGQPLIVREKDDTFLLLGCYDHNLKKIDARTGNLIWSYEYDDVIKGTGSIWQNETAENPENSLMILQGSRLGNQNSLAAKHVYSYRAVSYFTGNEIWRMNSKRSQSYSRDVDASALFIGDTAYIGLENGSFISFGPGEEHLTSIASTEYFEPSIFQELPLFAPQDAYKHGGNLVTEASPARIKDHIYIASGSGHVYGYNVKTKKMDWTFDIGADLDGSPVVTADGCLLITVEKQYIKGKGGVFKLDPSKSPDACVVWYFPTQDRAFADWKGGVIGSVSINDVYNQSSEYPSMAAFTGIDGWLYVVSHDEIDTENTCLGPNNEKEYPMPRLLEKRNIGPSISTPIFVKDKIVAAGYHGINLYQINTKGKIVSSIKKPGVFEATPVADQGKIYIASRNGYLYCLGSPGLNQSNSDLLAEVKVEPEKIKPKEKPPTITKPKKKPKAVSSSSQGASNLSPIKTTEALSKLNSGQYYLIAGAFGVKSNAINTVNKFRGKGLKAFVAEGPNDLHYVVVGESTSESGIGVIKDNIRNQYGVDAWVYQKD